MHPSNTGPNMIDIFLSYKREEKDIAQQLYEALAGKGYKVWWDVDLLPGDNFIDSIEKIIDESKLTITLWSNLSVKSKYVRSESRRALKQSKQISTLIDIEADSLPMPFGEYQAIKLSGKNSTDLEALLRVVGDRLPLPKNATKFENTIQKEYAEQSGDLNWQGKWKIAVGFDDVDEYRLFLKQCSKEANIEVVDAAKRRIHALNKMTFKKLVRWLLPLCLSLIIAGAAVLNLYFSNQDQERTTSSSTESEPEQTVEASPQKPTVNGNGAGVSDFLDQETPFKMTEEVKSGDEIEADTRENIKTAQRLLRTKKYYDGEYYYDGEIDGLVGNKTHHAIQKFSWVSGEALEYPIDWSYWADFLRESKHDGVVKSIQRDLHKIGFLDEGEITGLETDSYWMALKVFVDKMPSIPWSKIKEQPAEEIKTELGVKFGIVKNIHEFQDRNEYTNVYKVSLPITSLNRYSFRDFLEFRKNSSGEMRVFYSEEAKRILPAKTEIFKSAFNLTDKDADQLYALLDNNWRGDQDSLQDQHQILKAKNEEGYPSVMRYSGTFVDHEDDTHISPMFGFKQGPYNYIVSLAMTRNYEEDYGKLIFQASFDNGLFKDICLKNNGLPSFATCNFYEEKTDGNSISPNYCRTLFENWVGSQLIETAIYKNFARGISYQGPSKTLTVNGCSFLFEISDFRFLKVLE